MTRNLFPVFIAGLAISPAAAPGQAKPTEAAKPPVAVKKEEPAKDEQTVDYEKFVKDLTRVNGSMALYQKGKSLFLELPEDRIGKLFLIQAAFETGLDTMFLHPGMSIGGSAVDAFRFDRKEDTISLVRPVISNRWQPDDPFKVGAERSFPEAFLGTYRVEQENKQKHLLLVNITPLFSGDLFRLNEMVAGSLGGPYMLDPTRSGPEAEKGFPDTTTVQMRLHYFSPRGGGEGNPLLALLGLGGNTLEDERSAPVRVNYTMWWSKDDGYRPRLSDPRIGYFTTDFFSLDRYLSQDKTERYINRFNLQKKDPTAKLSEPVKPITFTIDPSIPEKWRPAVKEGVLRWNRAFEEAGFKNAIQVQEVAKDDKDYDHADGRYNVIRMMVGPSAPFAAISLPRTDPFTGEILNASITIDGNAIQSLLAEHDRYLPPLESLAETHVDRVLLRDRSRATPDDRLLFATNRDALLEQASSRVAKFGWSQEQCEFSQGEAELAALDYMALSAAPAGSKISRDDYVRMYLAECVSHEVGHCLGLRHNFAGSTALSTEQLADESVTSKQGISASVMDYTPPNAQAILHGKSNVFMSTVGPYDKWAIEYGYSPISAQSISGEKYRLSQIASHSGEPGHAYLSDDDADSFNPKAVRFDCASDPLAFSAKQLAALRRSRDWAVANLPRPGQSYSARTSVVLNTISRSFSEGRIAARFVGGTYGNRNFKGDAMERPTLQPVPASVQRQAVRLIANDFFAPDSFALPTSVMESLSTDEDSNSWNAPLREVIGSLQSRLLALSLSAQTTDRIVENAYKAGKDAYGIDEHYSTIMGGVFSEVGQSKSISPLRRDLQRFALNALIMQAGASQGQVSDDVRLVASDSLERIDSRIKSQLAQSKKLDRITILHLKDCHDQATRFFSRHALSR